MRHLTLRSLTLALPLALCLGCGGGGSPAPTAPPDAPDPVDAAVGRLAGTTATLLLPPPEGLPGHEDLLFVLRTEDGWEAGAFGERAVLGTGLTELRLLYRPPVGPPLLVTVGPEGVPTSIQSAGTHLRIHALASDGSGGAQAVVQPVTAAGPGGLHTVPFGGDALDALRRLQALHGTMDASPGVRPPDPAARKPGDLRDSASTVLQVLSFSFDLFSCGMGIAMTTTGALAPFGVLLAGYGCVSHLSDWGRILRGEDIFTGPMDADTLAGAVGSCGLEALLLHDRECLLGVGLNLGTAALGGLTDVTGVLSAFDEETAAMDRLLVPMYADDLQGTTWEGTWFNTIVNGAGGCTYTNGGTCRIALTSATVINGPYLQLQGSTHLTGIDVRNTSTCAQLPSVSNTGAFYAVFRDGRLGGSLFSGAAAFSAIYHGDRIVGTLYRNGAPYGEFHVVRTP